RATPHRLLRRRQETHRRRRRYRCREHAGGVRRQYSARRGKMGSAGEEARFDDSAVGWEGALADIVGTWRLIKTSARNDAGEPRHPPYGNKPRGLVVFYRDKRMMSVLCDSRSRLPDGETVREYNSYCGNYEYDGKTLVTHVDASADPGRMGGDQVRFVAFDG